MESSGMVKGQVRFQSPVICETQFSWVMQGEHIRYTRARSTAQGAGSVHLFFYIIGATLSLIISYFKYLRILSELSINELLYMLFGSPNILGLVSKRPTDNCPNPSPMPNQVLLVLA